MKPLHIEAVINGFPIAMVLVDNGVVINVLPIATFKRLHLNENGLVSTDITVCGFNGGSSACLGVIPITLQIGTKVKETVFFVVDVATTFNALLGRDWLHKAGAIPSTLHQELAFWHNDQVEVVVGSHAFCKQANVQAVSVGAEERIPLPNDMSLPQRYKLGDPTVGPLGQPSGKFDYLVSYDAPCHKKEIIIPTGWGQDDQPPLLEKERSEKAEGTDKVTEPKDGAKKIEIGEFEQGELSPLEVDMAQAGILLLLEQHSEGTDWEPERLPDDSI